jgi:thioredoxin-related protein
VKILKISFILIVLFSVACTSNNREKEHGHEHNSEEQGHPHNDEESSETHEQEEFIIEKDSAVQVKSKLGDHGHSHDKKHNHNH